MKFVEKDFNYDKYVKWNQGKDKQNGWKNKLFQQKVRIHFKMLSGRTFLYWKMQYLKCLKLMTHWVGLTTENMLRQDKNKWKMS